MREEVKKYYGQALQSSDDLQTNACCTGETMPEYLKPILASIHDEVHQRYYGCGLVLPEQIGGCTLLDLGSGSGRDCFALSALVGANGQVIGVDMTEEQLAVANRHIAYHQQVFGYKSPNVRFIKGELEQLEQLDIEDNSIDVIVSNCVINLCQDKPNVLKQAYRLLKPGGEMYFSDVYADRRIPSTLSRDPILYGECLSGAFYWNDFENAAKSCGFTDPRLVKDSVITIENPVLKDKCGEIRFFSATYRLFKLDGLEPFCEDYGQAVIYKGTIDYHPNSFTLDKHHHIPKGKVFPVCGNTYRMLHDTRFREHFEFIGNWDTHFGIFEGCGAGLPFDTEESQASEGNGCC